MRETETDARGYFRMEDLPVGVYQIWLALVGHRPLRFDFVAVRLGRTTSLGVNRLEIQAFELEEIVVNAEQPLVDVTSAATVTNLPSELIGNLPVERDFNSIVSLAPLTSPSQFGGEVGIAGSTGPENAYYVDGVNVTNPRFGGGGSSDLPYNFISEVQVKAAGYEAEFGRATGGIIDVITHSGGNRFGGQIFGFFTNSSLTATPRFTIDALEETDFTEYDLGGSLGGPILRDRLWFFAAYNPSSTSRQIEVPGAGLQEDWQKEHLFATKLTWQPATHTDVVVTIHGAPGRKVDHDLGLALDSVADLGAVKEGADRELFVLSGLMRRRLGNAAQAELGLSRLIDGVTAQDASGRLDPFFEDLPTGVVSGGYGFRRRTNSVRTGLRGSVGVAVGRHALKAGLEYEDNDIHRYVDGSAEPGSPQGSITRVDESTYHWFRDQVNATLSNRILSGYGQDSWRATDRITLNLGVRWEAQYLIRPDGRTAQRFTDLWQPRAGFVYQPGAQGLQKLFGSYARFYEQFPLQLPLTYYHQNPGRTLVLEYDHDPRINPSGADTVYDSDLFTGEELPTHADLEGQSVDEFTVGYERAVGRQLRVGIRGIYRSLRWAVEDAFDVESGDVWIGNPGRGQFSELPRARRTYHALALTFEKPQGRRFIFSASYVLSRSHGNYEGLSVNGSSAPNITPTFDFPEVIRNSTGLLPTDKPHTVKISGFYKFDFGLTMGTALIWMSGEPRNEFGLLHTDLGEYPVFVQPRGTAGRTSSVFDASLRFTYALQPSSAAVRPRIYFDLFHLGNQRTVLHFEELRYLEVDADGNPVTPYEFYGTPQGFQPPMSARLGLQVDFGGPD